MVIFTFSFDYYRTVISNFNVSKEINFKQICNNISSLRLKKIKKLIVLFEFVIFLNTLTVRNFEFDDSLNIQEKFKVNCKSESYYNFPNKNTFLL